jgi:hypothetical protein
MRIDVRQEPGMRYPAPANRAWIVEQNFPCPGTFQPTINDHREIIADPGCECAY